MKNYGARLMELRKARGLSQDEVAEKVGLKKRQYQNYEYSNSPINLEMFVKILDALDCSADYFLQRGKAVDVGYLRRMTDDLDLQNELVHRKIQDIREMLL